VISTHVQNGAAVEVTADIFVSHMLRDLERCRSHRATVQLQRTLVITAWWVLAHLSEVVQHANVVAVQRQRVPESSLRTSVIVKAPSTYAQL
jgi:hypothetical protein